MVKESLSLEETKQMFIHVAKGMIQRKDELTKADQAIGDGDHGIGMARGFEAVRNKLSTLNPNTIADLFKSIGMTLLTAVGGAAGAIFGTFFRGAAENVKYRGKFDSETLVNMLSDGLLAVKMRGKAEPGDKTMVDALEPATIKAREFINEPLAENIKDVVEEARIGVENTKQMIASFGKAKPLGERSLGHPDPGAISIYLILKFMGEFINNL